MNTEINLNEIPINNTYQGYLWWSNQQKPEVYMNESLPAWPSETANPYIVEGNLVDKTNRKSYLIRFIDGKYKVNQFDLEKIESRSTNEVINREFLPNRMEGVEKLYFKEIWQPEKDEFCESMEVLKPAMIVFTGLK